jgi:hypothetical protein
MDPLPAATSEEVPRPEGSADVPSAATVVEPPSSPDAKSTFGNEHEQIAVMPTTASRAEIAHVAMDDRRTQFSF